MISFFGMSKKIGNRSFYDSSGQQEYSFNKPYSEKTAETIDDEVKSLIDVQYDRAKALLRKNKKGLKELAEILLEKEVIFSDDLQNIFGKRPWVVEEIELKPIESSVKPKATKKAENAVPVEAKVAEAKVAEVKEAEVKEADTKETETDKKE